MKLDDANYRVESQVKGNGSRIIVKNHKLRLRISKGTSEGRHICCKRGTIYNTVSSNKK